jgi:DNA polymerase I-like protein with 3'-5' exonuclease and polymerase domains
MIIRSETDLYKAENLLRNSLYWTYDIETSGLNPRKDQLIGFGCCNPNNLSDKFYIITKEFVDGKLITLISDEALKPILQKLEKLRLIMHNGSFDTRFTIHQLNTDLRPALYCDTMLLQHTINENLFSYALKTLAATYFGDQEKDAQADMLASIKSNGGSEKEYYKANSTVLATYALKDVELTARLFNLLSPQLKSRGLEDFFYKDEVMPLYSNVTINMELKGVPVDVQLLQQTKTEISLDIEQLEAEIQAAIAPKLDLFNDWYFNRDEFKVKMSGQFLQTLAEQIAPSDWPKTDSGSHSFSEAAFKPKKKKGSIDLSHLLEHDLYAYYSGKKRVPEALATTIKQKMYASTGQLYAFNLQSTDHLKRLFFTKLQEEPLSKTPTGQPQINDDFLEKMATKYNWAAKLRTYNKLNKIKGTYVEGTLEKSEDGIFYPNFYQHKTVSGRYGSNLQQLSRPMEPGQAEDVVIKYNNRIRKFFIAGPNHKIIGADYSSLEPMVFAHVSNDEGLRNIFRNGLDFYSLIAIQTEGLTDYSPDKKAPNYLGKLNKQARQKAKAYCLSVPYGSTPYALSKTLEIGEEEARLLYNKYLDAFPELKKWMQESVNFVKENGYMKTESGRIRNFPQLKSLLKKYSGIDMTNALEVWKEFHDTPASYTQAKSDASIIKNCLNNSRNIQIQGLGASIVNRAAIAVANRLKEYNNAYIFANVHDEMLIRCKEEDVEEVSKIIQHHMENTYKISVNLIAEPSVGNNIYEAK